MRNHWHWMNHCACVCARAFLSNYTLSLSILNWKKTKWNRNVKWRTTIKAITRWQLLCKPYRILWALFSIIHEFTVCCFFFSFLFVLYGNCPMFVEFDGVVFVCKCIDEFKCLYVQFSRFLENMNLLDLRTAIEVLRNETGKENAEQRTNERWNGWMNERDIAETYKMNSNSNINSAMATATATTHNSNINVA